MSKKDKAPKGFPVYSAECRPLGFGLDLGGRRLHPEVGVGFGMTPDEFIQYLRDAFGAENVSVVTKGDVESAAREGDSEPVVAVKPQRKAGRLRRAIRIDAPVSECEGQGPAPSIAVCVVKSDVGPGLALAGLAAQCLEAGAAPLRVAMCPASWRALGCPAWWNGVPVRVEVDPPIGLKHRDDAIGWVAFDCRPGEWLDMTNGQRAWVDGVEAESEKRCRDEG